MLYGGNDVGDCDGFVVLMIKKEKGKGKGKQKKKGKREFRSLRCERRVGDLFLSCERTQQTETRTDDTINFADVYKREQWRRFFAVRNV